LVAWCDDPTVAGYTLTHREGCHKLAVLVTWTVDGKTIGTATFLVHEEFVVENKKDFHQRLFMGPLSIDAALGTVSLDYWDAICTGL
jgi:hypothetical protein